MGDLAIVEPSALDAPQRSVLAPSNMAEAMELAKMLAGSLLIPEHLRGKPADCLMIIEQAIRWDMSPLAVAQSTSIVRGKLMFEGKLVAAVINSRGNLAQRLSYTYAGESDARAVTVSGRIRGEAAPRTIDLALRNARTDNSFWRSQPDQQLAYAGARVWARRHMPELMLGVQVPEDPDATDLPSDDTEPAIQAPRRKSEAQVIAETVANTGAPAASIAAEVEPAADTDKPLTVVDVREESGETTATRKDGTRYARQWTRFDVALSDGRVAATFSSTLAEKARAARDSGATVVAETATTPKGNLELKALTFADEREPGSEG